MNEHFLEVGKDFATISEALAFADSLEGAVTIHILPGTYKERLTITRPYLTLCGDDAMSTIITYDLGAYMTMEDGSRRGTFRSYSVLVDTHDFTAKNLTFENSAGDGRKAGQAIAVYAEGERITFDSCRLLGCQDTLFTGPLPPAELSPGGFVGPKQFAPRINGRQYYRRCYIRGDVDFIFGSATVYFEECDIFSNDRGEEINGYVTAPSTPEGQEYGYVFDRCRLLGDCPANTVYLGRPWRNYARTVFLNCYMGEHIRREGVHDWNKPVTHETAYWAEYKSYGPGASDSRADYMHVLSDDEAKHFSRENVLGF